MTELQAKYQKLATEYSKGVYRLPACRLLQDLVSSSIMTLRAQIPVLKKAVIDEQSKSEALQEKIKDKDQSIRKYGQEVESLSFRNQQLSTRVTVLQDDLEGTGAKVTKKNKMLQVFKKSSPKAESTCTTTENDSMDVIGAELQSKIEENARLHSKVFEVDLEYQQTVTTLKDRLQILEGETSQHQHILDSTVNENKSVIDKLRNDKIVLQVELQKREQEAKICRTRTEEAEDKLNTMQRDLGGQLSDANRVINGRLCFNDAKHVDLNAFNIPVHDRQHQLQARELISQAYNLIQELTQGLSNFYTYSEQRVQAYHQESNSDPLSDANDKFCRHLRENATYLRLVEHSYKAFYEETREDTLITLDTATGLQMFSKEFNNFVDYASKIQPYYALSIEEECSLSSCSQTLHDKNMSLHASLHKFIDSISSINSYLATIVSQSSTTTNFPRENMPRLFELFASSITTFHECTKDISKHFNAKISLEHQLPTITSKLKTTDECLAASLFQLVTTTGKLSAFMSGNVNLFTATNVYNQSQTRIHPTVTSLKAQTCEYLNKIAKSRSDSVPYTTAVHNRKTLLSSSESSASLAQQVVTLQDKITCLEQDKQHWMLESQLLQMKYEKQVQKIQLMEKEFHTLDIKQNGSIDENMESTAITNENNKLNRQQSYTGSIIADDSSQAREELIKSHFSERISSLITNLQLADSQALNFNAECRALHKRLLLTYKQRNSLQEQVTTQSQLSAQLKDELQTTTRSYEGQLSMMSEHLAVMNEKLATQKDEIEMLKYHLNNTKAVRKGK